MQFKKIHFCILFVAAASILLLSVYCCQTLYKDFDCRYNLNQSTTHANEVVVKNLTFSKAEANIRKRIKRFIIYDGSGVVKVSDCNNNKTCLRWVRLCILV